MTGWWGIYTSKKKQDMLWPDMTWVSHHLLRHLELLLHLQLPAHALLVLRPGAAAWPPPWPAWLGTRAAWIQNRALHAEPAGACSARWCPCSPTTPSSPCQSVNNPDVNLVVSVLALAANVAAVGCVAYRAQEAGRQPLQARGVRRHAGLREAPWLVARTWLRREREGGLASVTRRGEGREDPTNVAKHRQSKRNETHRRKA